MRQSINFYWQEINLFQVFIFYQVFQIAQEETNKIWANQSSEIYNKPVKKWLGDNDIEMYSVYYEGKSVVADCYQDFKR